MATKSSNTKKASTSTYVRRSAPKGGKVVVARQVAAKAAAPKARARVDYDALVRKVEAGGRPVRVPGRRVAFVSLETLERLRELERAAREAEDRADGEAFLAHERQPGELKPWSELRAAIVA